MKKTIEMPTFERPVLKPVLRSPGEDGIVGISICGCVSAVDCAKPQQLNAHSLHGDQQANKFLDTRHSVCKFGIVRHLIKTHLMTNNRPPSIDNTELCFLSSDVALCMAHATAKTHYQLFRSRALYSPQVA